MSLCIEGCMSVSKNGQMQISLTPHSKCILLFCLYPIQWKELNIIVSIPDSDFSQTVADAFNINTHKLLQCSVQAVSYSDLKEDLRSVLFPCLRLNGSSLIHSGPTAVIRALVLKGIDHLAQPPQWIVYLLGRNKSCLKACKEKSKWTMFCEVTLPNNLTQGINNQSGQLNSLDDLAESFRIPIRIHNRSKLQLAVQYSNKLNAYLEGPNRTLVDIICSFFIQQACNDSDYVAHLVEGYPGITKWLERIKLDTGYADAINLLKLVSVKWLTTEELLNPNESLDFSLVKGIEKLSICAKNVTDLEDIVRSVKFADLQLACPDNENRFVDWTSLDDAFHPRDGEVPPARLELKCHQLANIAGCILSLVRPGDVIVDFCSGGGHLGLLLASLLPSGCRVVLLDNKEESLMRAEARLARVPLDIAGRVLLYKGNMLGYRGRVDIGVALHACGTCTDLVIDMCLAANCQAFVVSPCCYGSIKPGPNIAYPRSMRFKTVLVTSPLSGSGEGIDDLLMTLNNYSKLCHASDMSSQESCNSHRQSLGEQAMIQVDSDRAWYAIEKGYQVHLTKMVPHNCTPRNNIIVGCKRTET